MAQGREDATDPADAKAAEPVLELIAERQKKLRAEAGLLGRRLLADKSRAATRRMAVWWEVARTQGEEELNSHR